MAIFLGLHSSLIHFVSVVSSSMVLSSVVWLVILSDIRIPTPPVLFFRFFPIYLYPLILAVSLLVSLDSDIRAISFLSACSRVCRLFVFHCRPLVSILATTSFLFFFILGLLCFFLSWFHLDWVLIPLSCLVTFFLFVVVGLLG